MPEGVKIIANNKRAWHDYFVEEKFEAGIELFGTEVKSIRNGGISLKESYCFIENGQLYVRGMHVSPYEKGNIFNRDPLRERRLLMHKREILKLFNAVRLDGLTLIPLSVYLKRSRVKLEIGICRGKKLYDKREDIAKKTAQRETERSLREKNRM